MKSRLPLYSTVALAAILSVAWVVSSPSSALAGKHPEPSADPVPDAWYLDFKHGVPKRIVVELPAEKVPVAYWYLTYTVINNTNQGDKDFYPDFEMVTQDGKIRKGDRHVPIAAFAAIKKAENNDLLLPSTEIVGVLHEKEDQAKDGVVIWEEPMSRMGAFSIYVAGLNSEFIAAVDDQGQPIRDAQRKTADEPKGEPIILRKTLELNYVIWGDEIRPGEDIVQKKGERWVMR